MFIIKEIPTRLKVVLREEQKNKIITVNKSHPAEFKPVLKMQQEIESDLNAINALKK